MNQSQALPGTNGARRAPLIAGALIIAAVGLLAACGGQSATVGTVSGEPMPADAMMTEGMAPEAMPGQSGKVATATDQQVIRTAFVSIRVDDVAETGSDVIALVKESNGVVQQQDLSNSADTTYETITARVPAERLDAFLKEISGLGTVENLSRQASDVTQQTVDLEARIGALSTSVDRLKQLLAATVNVADLVAVETELANRQAELDSLVSQRDYLADQVSYSTVTIALSPVVEAIGVTPPGFGAGLRNGWTAFVTLAGATITALGFLLPFILLSSAIATPIIVAVAATGRRRRRRAAAGASSESGAGAKAKAIADQPPSAS